MAKMWLFDDYGRACHKVKQVCSPIPSNREHEDCLYLASVQSDLSANNLHHYISA